MPRYLAFAPVILLSAVGCDPPDPPPPAAPVAQVVRGQVIYKDKPAAGVRVTFVPSTGSISGGPPTLPNGITQADGSFTLSYAAEGDGAPAGSYQVVLYWPSEPAEPGGEPGEDRLFGWYDVKHSELTVTVKDGENALAPFKLPEVTGPPPPVAGIPGRN